MVETFYLSFMNSFSARSLPGNWTAFWWYDSNTTWPANETDVLAYNFGHCQTNDRYCFGRLPVSASEDSTEMLAVDSEGTMYKWSFTSSNNPVANAVWRAFHDHEIILPDEVKNQVPAWNPEVLNGSAPLSAQDSFMYREQYGVKSVLLDDDGCECYSTLLLGHGICHVGHNPSYSPAYHYGVDTLFDPVGCPAPPPDIGLTLYFRFKEI